MEMKLFNLNCEMDVFSPPPQKKLPRHSFKDAQGQSVFYNSNIRTNGDGMI